MKIITFFSFTSTLSNSNGLNNIHSGFFYYLIFSMEKFCVVFHFFSFNSSHKNLDARSGSCFLIFMILLFFQWRNFVLHSIFFPLILLIKIQMHVPVAFSWFLILSSNFKGKKNNCIRKKVFVFSFFYQIFSKFLSCTNTFFHIF